MVADASDKAVIITKEINVLEYRRLSKVCLVLNFTSCILNTIPIIVDKCWFCLSSPDVEKHLIITVGEHFYLALAKGPINKHHVMILSTKHVPCAAQLSPDDWKELNKFKAALRKFFKTLGQVVCFTERHYKSVHLQINALAFEEGYAWKIKHSFEVCSRHSTFYNIWCTSHNIAG